MVELEPGAASRGAAPVQTQRGPTPTAVCVDVTSEWSSWTVSSECYYDGGWSQRSRRCSGCGGGECWSLLKRLAARAAAGSADRAPQCRPLPTCRHSPVSQAAA